MSGERTAAPVVAQAAIARTVYPNYDVEGLPDARHDEAGAVYTTGKIRALKPSAGGTPTPTGAHRPPVLASEALREDLRPLEPGLQTARWASIACGFAIGLVGLWALEGATAGLAVLAIAAGLVCTALIPLNYALRATLQVALATSLVAGSSVAKVILNADTRPGLVLPIVVLATGLFFRSWHRASRHARWVVAVGVVLAAGWLGWSDGIDAVLGAGQRWQSWLPAAVRLALAPVLLASLLAFMGETTTGGCAAWAGCALAWYAAVSIIDAVAAVPTGSHALPTLEALRQGLTAARLLSALSAPVLAVSIAQLMVVATSEPKDAASPTSNSHPS